MSAVTIATKRDYIRNRTEYRLICDHGTVVHIFRGAERIPPLDLLLEHLLRRLYKATGCACKPPKADRLGGFR